MSKLLKNSISFVIWIFLGKILISKAVFSHHFSVQSNSDALYTYLFAKDLVNNITIINGWALPPSNYFFPDVFLFYLTLLADFSFYDIFCVWIGFLLFLLFKISREYSGNFLGSLFLPFLTIILTLGDLDQKGQWLLPGFHSGMILGFYILSKNNQITMTQIFILLLLSISDLWFLPTILLPFVIFNRYFSSYTNFFKNLAWFSLFYIFISKWINSFFSKAFAYSNIPISWKVSRLFHSLIQQDFFTWFLLILFLYSIYQLLKLNSDRNSKLVLLASWNYLFLLGLGLPSKTRYLVIAYLCLGILILKIWNRLPLALLRNTLFFGLVGSHSIFSHLSTSNLTLRTECFVGAPVDRHWVSDYWSAKYMKVFSNDKIAPLPVDEYGNLYHWIHNRRWHKEWDLPSQYYFYSRKEEKIPVNGKVEKEKSCGDGKILSIQRQ